MMSQVPYEEIGLHLGDPGYRTLMYRHLQGKYVHVNIPFNMEDHLANSSSDEDESSNNFRSVKDLELDEALYLWFNRDKNPATRAELKQLAGQGDILTLSTLLLNRLEFGTAGLRGAMGAGYSRMNDLVIIQTSQGLCQYILDQATPQTLKPMNVVIGYDGRHNSRRFAELTAAAMMAKNIKVHLFSNVCPTPFVPYAVKHFRSRCGIMITASHNPKEDNGYKVYWNNAAQIISPHDRGIQQSILKNLEPWENAWKTDTFVKNTSDPLDEVMNSYYAILLSGTQYLNHNMTSPLRFTYTPMHGVGQDYMERAFDCCGLKPFISVDLQKDPDPEFPTVKFPNPEEGKSALDLAIQAADANKSTVILANDPDADRLAVAEKCANGTWKIFNGNELGALLGWWSYDMYFAETMEKGEPFDKENCYMIASTVSSKFLKTMAKVEGFNFVETLTGFKWMGNKALDIMAKDPKAKILFAYEEAIGFMMGTTVLDKDGISAGIRVAELCIYLESQKLTLQQKLEQLYDKYGYHVSENSYFTFSDHSRVSKLFFDLRTYYPDTFSMANYPKSILNGKYDIIAVRDLTSGYDSSQENKLAVLPISRSTEMITFEFSNGLVTTLRKSGTEYKVKYYAELMAPPGEKNLDKLHAVLREMVDAIIAEFLRPNEFRLTPQGF